MKPAEFERWVEFYMLAPFDDLHRFYRPSALVSTSLAGGKIEEKLEWLQPSRVAADYSDADMATFKAFGIKPPNR